MGKTYYIRKVRGGGVSSGTLKKKKRVLVSFPHSAPLQARGLRSSSVVQVMSRGQSHHVTEVTSTDLMDSKVKVRPFLEIVIEADRPLLTTQEECGIAANRCVFESCLPQLFIDSCKQGESLVDPKFYGKSSVLRASHCTYYGYGCTIYSVYRPTIKL